MSKLLTIIALAVSLCGCSTTKSVKVVDHSLIETVQKRNDKAFDPYIALFKLEAEKRGVQIPYLPRKFKTYFVKNLQKKYGAIGICHFEDGYIKVLIDWQHWRKASYYERELLMFHELGHCVFDFEHDNRTDKDGNPVSIMHAHENFASLYASRRDYYLNEFYGKILQRMQMQMMLEGLQQ